MMSHRLLYQRGAAARFQREAATLMKLEHPNVTRVYDCFPAYRTSFIAMEFCDGVDVDRLRARHGALAEEDVRRIVGQIALALGHLHEHHIVHRDLKPSNVMLTREGVAKITDFGLARQVGLPTGTSITEECSIIGTPRYMSVSRLAGERPGPESDVYSLGLIALELCQGAPPFLVTNLADLIRQKEVFLPPPASAIGRGISDELHAFIVAATTGSPSEALAALARAATWAAPAPASLVAAV
jgi:serine/threonine-protein kinase